MMDPNEDPGGGGGGGDWFEENAPPAGDPFADQLNALYQEYYGRPASPGEVEAHRGNPGGLAAVRQTLQESQVTQGWQPAPVTPAGTTNNTGGNTGGYNGPAQTTNLGLPTSGYGAAPPRYTSDPNAPVYEELAAYVPPTWDGGDYVNPTEAELYATPGYQARLNEGLKSRTRAAAAGGTILNGGTLKALDRYGQDYATNEYQTLRGNTLENYKQRYGQFQDKATMSLQARTANANEHQNSFQNRTNTYLQGNNRTLTDYLTNLTAQRNAEMDYWSRLQDVNQTGAGLAGGSR